MCFRFRNALFDGCAAILIGSLAVSMLSASAFASPTAREASKISDRRTLDIETWHGRRTIGVLPRPRPHGAHPRSMIYRVPSYLQRLVQASEPAMGWPALVLEARKYLGTNPTDRKRLWCATFMNFILAKLGYSGTHSDAARSFAYYGKRIPRPEVGAVAVLTRGRRGGHVGVVTGVDPNGNPIIISGNHNKRVGEGLYPRSRVIAYVMPTRRRALYRPVRASRVAALRPNRTLDSPIDELIATIEADGAHVRAGAPAPARHRSAPRLRRQARWPGRLVQQAPD